MGEKQENKERERRERRERKGKKKEGKGGGKERAFLMSLLQLHLQYLLLVTSVQPRIPMQEVPRPIGLTSASLLPSPSEKTTV